MIVLSPNYLSEIEKYKNEDSNIFNDVHIHHILPKCCGGTDDKQNLVKVSIFHHVMLHKLILSNISGITPIQREKLLYAYKKMRSTYLEKKPIRVKRSKKPKSKRELSINNDLKKLYDVLKLLEDRYVNLSYTDTSLLNEIQQIKKWIRILNHCKKNNSSEYNKYLKSSFRKKINDYKL